MRQPRRKTPSKDVKGSFNEKAVHPQRDLVVKLVKAHLNRAKEGKDQITDGILLVGPTGAGKTTLVSQVAEELGLPFRKTGAVDSEYKLTGFKTAHGDTMNTNFRLAYQKGGLFLFDEADASDPNAMITLNSIATEPFAEFPDQQVLRHPEFVFMATANTYGKGADRDYVGRNKLDAATLDRFTVVYVDYDEDFERGIAKKYADDKTAAFWTEIVQTIRRTAAENHVKIIISPRVSIKGAAYLDEDVSLDEVLEISLWKGLAQEDRMTILKACRDEVNAIFKKHYPDAAQKKAWKNVWKEFFSAKKDGDELTHIPK